MICTKRGISLYSWWIMIYSDGTTVTAFLISSTSFCGNYSMCLHFISYIMYSFAINRTKGIWRDDTFHAYWTNLITKSGSAYSWWTAFVSERNVECIRYTRTFDEQSLKIVYLGKNGTKLWMKTLKGRCMAHVFLVNSRETQVFIYY